MLHFEDKVALKASAQVAWDSFKIFDRIDAWHPATEHCVMLEGENGKPLAVREFQLKGGGFVISELLDYDEARKWFKYRILKTNLPLKSYVGEMSVAAAPGGGSVVHWSADFRRPDGNANAAEADAATMKLVQTVFESGLANIAKITGR